jgi:hemerythrin-like domain-containing protein
MIYSEKEQSELLKYYEELVYFLKIFADKCHHGKEENYLFKELINKGIPNQGGPVGAMLSEHELGRKYIAEMTHSLAAKDIVGINSAAAAYSKLLRLHIEKENNVLFPIADKVIDERQQEHMFEQFEQFEETVIGQGVHDKLHAMIDTWAEVFGVEW